MVVAAFAPIGGIRQGFAPVSLVAPAFNTPTCALVGATRGGDSTLWVAVPFEVSMSLREGIPDFHEEMDRFQNHIPTWVGHNLKRLRGERAKWVRVPMGVALIGGGVLGFLPLPIVSIWMLPVGLALLAHDVPTMRRPMARLLHFTNRKIEKRKS